MGWVSIVSNKKIKKLLNIPRHIKPIAYLCLGYVSEFSILPDLEKSRWLNRINLNDIIYFEKWGKNFTKKGQNQ